MPYDDDLPLFLRRPGPPTPSDAVQTWFPEESSFAHTSKCGRPADAAPVAVKKRDGAGSGRKLGFGMFIVLPLLLFLAGCFVLMMIATAIIDGAHRAHESQQSNAGRAAAGTSADSVMKAYDDAHPRAR